jgi:hypothetical protein
MGSANMHTPPTEGTSDIASTALPAPVDRYFRHVLAEQGRPIHRVQMAQAGALRTDLRGERWLRFEAQQIVQPAQRSFCWDAVVCVMPLLRLRVRDAYREGIGSGQVRLWSAITLASARDTPELNAAALHRYLAEAVWYPTALLPAAGVQWSSIDEHRALATLSDGGNTVSLEFRFNEANEVSAVYAPGRWRRVGGSYVQTPWQGHFRDYRLCQGVLVPGAGEVGWYTDGKLQIVWKGQIGSLAFEFAR